MAETPGTIRIKVEMEEVVPTVVVARIADLFAEWLDSNGFAISHPTDDRDYETLGRVFAEEWADGTPG